MFNQASAITRWLVISQPNAQVPMRMFCFPYAGGSATIFQRWPERLPKQVEICSVQYPGRGARLPEPAFRHLAPLVESLAEAITPYLDKPFAFFGHSLGALLSFEVARHLHKQHGLSPIHMFLSGRGAPQIPVRELSRHNLPEGEFIEELRRLKGTPKEVLENPELMQLMIPILRADFSVSATYEYKIEPPLDCPFTVLSGLQDDDIGREMLE